MKIGIVSDTHGHVPFTLEAVRMFEQFELARIIHCGDIGSIDVPRLFGAWPTDYVFGNVDTEEEELREAIRQAGHTCHGRFGSLDLEGRRIAFLHGDDTRRLRSAITSGEWDLVCHGHTHIAAWDQVGSTHVLNPGAVFRARPRSVAVLSLPELEPLSIALQ